MPESTAASPWPRWHDLPLDLLGDISGRLHAAADYIRFHAVCKPWRDSLPPAPSGRPMLLPWLVAPRDGTTGHRTARCVFSSSKPSHHPTATTVVQDRDRTWVIRAVDGVAYWLVAGGDRDEPGGLVDPLTGARCGGTLPPFPDEIAAWVGRAAGAISGDGTIVLYAFCSPKNAVAPYPKTFNMAVLPPGGAAWWTFVQKGLYIYVGGTESCCGAYHHGRVIICYGRAFLCIVPAQPERRRTAFSDYWRWSVPPGNEPGGQLFQSSYLVESRGELLLACVRINEFCSKSWSCNGDVVRLAEALSVSVYVLQDEAQGVTPPQWVRRDGRSLADRVLFLGRPSSFAMDASRLGMNSGCAYFLDKRLVCIGDVVGNGCRLFKYDFQESKSEFIEEQPAEWTSMDAMWLTP